MQSLRQALRKDAGWGASRIEGRFWCGECCLRLVKGLFGDDDTEYWQSLGALGSFPLPLQTRSTIVINRGPGEILHSYIMHTLSE